MKSFTYRGSWWIPENEEDKVMGTITFSSEQGTKLELDGFFGELQTLLDAMNSQTPDIFPIIYGLTETGRCLTLIHSMTKSVHMSIPGSVRQGFICATAFVGVKPLLKDDLEFSKIFVEYSHLTAWIGRTGFHEERELRDDVFFRVRLTYERPEPIVITVGDTTISI